jgi:hypothetical protein
MVPSVCRGDPLLRGRDGRVTVVRDAIPIQSRAVGRGPRRARDSGFSTRTFGRRALGLTVSGRNNPRNRVAQAPWCALGEPTC